ncbi:MAG: hypothetical protein KKB77_00140 [Bacteroidetes bacterium]|nr:hypothetical protein [Bacteroidota bacterium]
MVDIHKAFSNLTSLLKTDKPSWETKSRFWFNCLTRIQQTPGANQLFERIANAPQSDLGDYLAELWFATMFKELGFHVIIDPLGDGPDMKISKQDFDIFVEVTCFRKIYPGPPDLTLSNTEEITLVEYGNWKRDANKAYKKILSKFPQLRRVEIDSSIVAIWNYDGDLEEIEMEDAVTNICRDGMAKKILIPENLKFVIFAPWDGKHLAFTISKSLTVVEKELIENISQQSIFELQSGELVKRCRLFCGDDFRPRPRIARVVRHIG